jgi:hypothetical protein
MYEKGIKDVSNEISVHVEGIWPLLPHDPIQWVTKKSRRVVYSQHLTAVY